MTIDTQQQAFTDWLRAGRRAEAAQRGDKIYFSLVFNNIAQLLAGNFPVMHSLFNHDEWLQLVRRFVKDHQSTTPLFTEIGQEFIDFLSSAPTDEKYPFLHQLADYEYVESRLFTQVDKTTYPLETLALSTPIQLSPYVQLKSYEYPVHLIHTGNATPDKSPTFLIIFRDTDLTVRFLTCTPISYLLISALSDRPNITLDNLCHEFYKTHQTLVSSLSLEVLTQHAEAFFNELASLTIIQYGEPAS